MKQLSKRIFTISALALAVSAAPQVSASTWSDTYIGYRYGTQFTEPNNKEDVQKNILQLTHASGYAYGQNFFNLDILKSDSKDKANNSDKGALEAYLTYRHQLHLGKVLNKDLSFGPVKEVALTAGFDLNTKNTEFAPRKELLVVGPTLKFGLPKGFADLSLLYAYERNHCGVDFCSVGDNKNDISFDPYYIVSVAWGVPFQAGPVPMKFQGFGNYNGAKGKDYFNAETKPEVLVRTSLMVDVGQLAFDKSNTLWAGVGYEYWDNKFGNHGKPGVDTRAPTFQMEWHF